MLRLMSDVREVQGLYPRIWHACHRHPQDLERETGLSDRQAQLLAHLADGRLRRPRDLAQHVGIRTSTLSEAIDDLVRRGLVDRRVHPGDRRRVDFQVTAAGLDALSRGSPLDADRVEAALALLSESDRKNAVDGLRLLAKACDALARVEPRAASVRR